MKTRQKINFRVIFAILFVLLVISIILFKEVFVFNLNKFFYPNLNYQIENSELKVHFLNVGNADCTIMQFPDNRKMLIDAGDNTQRSREYILKYLDEKIFDKNEEKIIDYFVYTHSHSDHIGGGETIFDKFEIKTCLRPKLYSESEASNLGISTSQQIVTSGIYETFIDKLYEENCIINYFSAGTQIEIGGVDIKFLAPLRNYYEKINNFSPVMVFSYADKKFMFVGDIEESVENEVLYTYAYSDGEYARQNLNVDVLKIAHHGSSTSTSQAFLNATTPNYAVISASGEDYNHPSDQTLENLKNANVENVLRTDKNGNIVFGVSNDDLYFTYATYGTGFKISWWELLLLTIVLGVTLILTIKPKSKYIRLDNNF